MFQDIYDVIVVGAGHAGSEAAAAAADEEQEELRDAEADGQAEIGAKARNTAEARSFVQLEMPGWPLGHPRHGQESPP